MSFGFVVVRHVNSKKTDEYWKDSYRCIRKFYDNKILIVDDNSNPDFLTDDLVMKNCEIVKSEYPARGEILGYYYFHKLRPFDKAVVLHDGVFFNRKIDFGNTGNVKFLWSFEHYWDDDIPTLDIISRFKDCGEVVRKYIRKGDWIGCFGVMAVITWDFLDKLDTRHDLFNVILDNVRTRRERQFIERVFPSVCYANDSTLNGQSHILGNIHSDYKWGITYEQYKSGACSEYPLIKVWTGR